MRNVTIAVVQPRLRTGEVEWNLRRLGDLARSAAREHGPDVLLLPEAMTSPHLFARAMHGVARPVDGAPLGLLRELARDLDCVVGGGFLAKRGRTTRGTYMLVEPDGTAHLHDKDQPSMWEAAYFEGGADDGLCSTSLGDVGIPMGFEWARSRTALRLRGKAQLVLGGSCWWSYPDWPVVRPWFSRDHQYNLDVARNLAPRMARATGAPAAIAQHVGEARGKAPLMPGVPYDTILVGESQVVDARGTALARLTYEDGEGHVAATVEYGAPAPADPVPTGFWSTPIPFSLHAVWHLYNAHGRASFAARRARGGHAWQSWPDTDLPARATSDLVEV